MSTVRTGHGQRDPVDVRQLAVSVFGTAVADAVEKTLSTRAGARVGAVQEGRTDAA
jgi:hypothetical protein